MAIISVVREGVTSVVPGAPSRRDGAGVGGRKYFRVHWTPHDPSGLIPKAHRSPKGQGGEGGPEHLEWGETGPQGGEDNGKKLGSGIFNRRSEDKMIILLDLFEERMLT